MKMHKFFNFNECLRINSGYLVTVNLQHLYECKRNKNLQTALFGSENASLCIDGRGAQIVFQRFLGIELPRSVGNELLHAKLCSLGCAKALVVGTNNEIMAVIKQKYPAVEFTHDSSSIPKLDPDNAKKVASTLTELYGTGFDFIALALGVPKQELLAQELTKLMPAAPIFCIGGSFEMLSGRAARAPVFMQRLGIEGVWRFLLQPNRDRFLRLVNSYWNFIRFTTNPRLISDLLDTAATVEK